MRNKLIAVVVLNVALLVGVILGAKCASNVQREIYIAHSLEALVCPPQNTFSPAARAYLLHWVDMSIASLHGTRKFALGCRRQIDDALGRLDRARSRLTEATAEPESGLPSLRDSQKTHGTATGLRG